MFCPSDDDMIRSVFNFVASSYRPIKGFSINYAAPKDDLREFLRNLKRNTRLSWLHAQSSVDLIQSELLDDGWLTNFVCTGLISPSVEDALARNRNRHAACLRSMRCVDGIAQA